jgi:hypothetical protein
MLRNPACSSCWAPQRADDDGIRNLAAGQSAAKVVLKASTTSPE